MAFIDMKSELAEAIPSMSRVYAGTLINRAWRVVRDSCLWSFQLGQGGFSTPSITTGGSISTTLGSNTLIGDAAATAQWANLPFMFAPTVQQIRCNGYSIYSIIAYDNGSDPVNSPNYPFATLTLDRTFIDPLPFYTGVGYQMFQAYIPAPPTFKRWLNIVDMTNCWALDIWTSRRTINLTDPARLYTSNPQCVLGLGTDQRGAGTATPSATLGQQLYELYPNPSTALSYMTYYVVQGADLVNNSDTLPYPITQEVVLIKAREYAYEWAEARKDVMAAKGSGANYALLKKEAKTDFEQRLKTLRLIDRDQVDSYQAGMMTAMSTFRTPYYNSTAGTANMGVGGWR
jgi:hypothetical protein